MRLIKTGTEDCLSGPISFESIQGEHFDPAASEMTTDFETAVDFLITLERREVNASCVDIDLNVLDMNVQPELQSRALRNGYTSG